MLEFGIASKTDVAKITLKSAPDRPGIGAQVFGALWSYDINVELISCTTGLDQGQDIILIVTKKHLNPAILKLKRIKEEIEAKDLLVDHDIAVISVTHRGLSKTPGIGAKVFSALSSANVNVDAVCSSTNAISCVIRAADVLKAEESLRKELEEEGKG
ncbi:MAG: ACT domain-containing protein [Candidatus Zixiibacteriota bacterium]